MEANTTRYVGIDLAKRTLEVRIIQTDGKTRSWHRKTDTEGRETLMKQLRTSDVVGFEACSLAFRLSREISVKVGAKVLVLNPGKLKIIYQSTKKTDSEDALKLAKLVQRFPEEELPVVPLPTEREERNRALVSEDEFWTRERTRLINRLHALYVRAGQTDRSKGDLDTAEARQKWRETLTDDHASEAARLEKMLSQVETSLGEVKTKEQEQVATDPVAPYLLSVPGVGPSMALAFSAFIGTGERFENGGQAAFYAGLVPRLDCSGEKQNYGHITKQGCTALRRLAVLNAWTLVMSPYGGPLKTKFIELKARRGSKIAIVAVARKLIELLWTLASKKALYLYMPEEKLQWKLKRYGISHGGSAA